MAASLGRLCVTGVRRVLRGGPPVSVLPVGVRTLCNPPEEFDVLSRYKEQPWEYLDSAEYLEHYGESLVWHNYRRNHKGPIPPQKTRKMCIRAGKVCGNPCPICRDQKLFVDFRNVKLLEQFICPHTGVVHDPSKTGVCMKQQQKLVKAITDAQDHEGKSLFLQTQRAHPFVLCNDLTMKNVSPRSRYGPFKRSPIKGLLPVTIHHKDLTFGDYSCNHGAVAQTSPPPEGPWYSWYEWQQPKAEDMARLRKLYRPQLKKMMEEE